MLDSLPDALLHLVFVKLPPETLLTSVCFANKRFKRLITDSEALWLSFLPPVLAKALREAPCSSASGCAPALRLPLLYGSLFHSNLLRNPWFSLEEQTAARRSRGQDVPGRAKTPWIAVGGGHLWAWGELAAEGLTAEAGATPPMPPPPLSPFSRQGGPSQWPTGAVAAGSRGAGYDWPILMQEVDLVAEMQQPGLPRQAACDYLDTSPPLVFEVFVAGRFDCPSRFEAECVLDGGQRPVPVDPTALYACLSGAIDGATTEESPTTPQAWQRHVLRLEGYAPGVRRALVVLRGTEGRGWAGHYGAKFSSPALRFAPPLATA